MRTWARPPALRPGSSKAAFTEPPERGWKAHPREAGAELGPELELGSVMGRTRLAARWGGTVQMVPGVSRPLSLAGGTTGDIPP